MARARPSPHCAACGPAHGGATATAWPDLEAAVTLLIPGLQRRGLCRTAYSGGTLRDTLAET